MSDQQNHQEIEVKLFTPDLPQIQQQLDDIGASLIKPRTYEHNTRFDNESGSFIDNKRVLRLRRDNNIRLTYKSPAEVINGISQREEIELTVDDFDAMQLILDRLGYHPSMVYEKYRTTYQYMDCEIVLDEMPYGNFTEIEGTTEQIEQVIQNLNWDHYSRIPHSYSGIFRIIKEALNLSFNDLTFEYFQNVIITNEIWEQVSK